MRAIIFGISLLLSLLFFQASAKDGTNKCLQSEALDTIIAALKTGNAKELVKNSLDPVEIGMKSEKKQSFNHAQAEARLKAFFTKYQPSGFEFVHQGTSQDGLLYVIGRYFYKGGEYQVYMLIKKSNGQLKIDTIDFSQD
jgi:hypothetical protein